MLTSVSVARYDGDVNEHEMNQNQMNPMKTSDRSWASSSQIMRLNERRVQIFNGYLAPSANPQISAQEGSPI